MVLTRRRIHEIRKIVKDTISETGGDLEFSEKISQRRDLDTIEKIYAGIILESMISEDKNHGNNTDRYRVSN